MAGQSKTAEGGSGAGSPAQSRLTTVAWVAALALGTIITAVPLVRWYRRRRDRKFEYGPVNLKEMTLAAAKELHAMKGPASPSERTSLVPDALLDLEEQAEMHMAPSAPSEEREMRSEILAQMGVKSFKRFLKDRKVPEPKRAKCTTLQLNIGLYCNQACSHCYVESSPLRKEMMSQEVVDRCLLLLKNSPGVKYLDITGGAPELNDGFRRLVEGATALRESQKRELTIIDRCNLTVLLEPGQETLPNFLAEHKVHVIASLPSYEAEQTDKQRGRKVFERSVQGLRILNQHGYGEGIGLHLDLVFNPPGPFLPPQQCKLQKQYKKELGDAYGIKFDRLVTICNMPITRYFDFLQKKGALEGYMDLLVRNFNEQTVPELMCTNTVNVGWDGKMYDCDFNQQLDLGLGRGLSVYDVTSLDEAKLKDVAIATGGHCFGCTAAQGSG